MTCYQSYVIKSAPWTILWFRILGIFSVENIKRLCVFVFQTCSNSQLLRRVLWISAEQTIGASLKHKNTQPLYIFNRVRVLHLNRLKEKTWLHSFGSNIQLTSVTQKSWPSGVVHYYCTWSAFLRKGTFNNYVDKKRRRGGQPKIHTCPLGGRGPLNVHMDQNLVISESILYYCAL